MEQQQLVNECLCTFTRICMYVCIHMALHSKFLVITILRIVLLFYANVRTQVRPPHPFPVLITNHCRLYIYTYVCKYKVYTINLMVCWKN